MIDWLLEYRDPEKAFGEVISSSHMHFSVQSYHEKLRPEYGSIIVVNSGDILNIGIIYKSEIVSAPGLPSVPVPLKATREDVRRRYPDLESRFIDIYYAILIGYYDYEGFHQTLPKFKPHVHDLAFMANSEFLVDLHKKEGTLHLEYLKFIIQSLDRNELLSLVDALFLKLSSLFSNNEKEELYKGVSLAISDFEGELVFDVISLARKHFLGHITQ